VLHQVRSHTPRHCVAVQIAIIPKLPRAARAALACNPRLRAQSHLNGTAAHTPCCGAGRPAALGARATRAARGRAPEHEHLAAPGRGGRVVAQQLRRARAGRPQPLPAVQLQRAQLARAAAAAAAAPAPRMPAFSRSGRAPGAAQGRTAAGGQGRPAPPPLRLARPLFYAPAARLAPPRAALRPREAGAGGRAPGHAGAGLVLGAAVVQQQLAADGRQRRAGHLPRRLAAQAPPRHRDQPRLVKSHAQRRVACAARLFWAGCAGRRGCSRQPHHRAQTLRQAPGRALRAGAPKMPRRAALGQRCRRPRRPLQRRTARPAALPGHASRRGGGKGPATGAQAPSRAAAHRTRRAPGRRRAAWQRPARRPGAPRPRPAPPAPPPGAPRPRPARAAAPAARRPMIR